MNPEEMFPVEADTEPPFISIELTQSQWAQCYDLKDGKPSFNANKYSAIAEAIRAGVRRHQEGK
jgi:hypothetical protein